MAAPAHLDGSLPADYGFDPLGLGADPDALKWYVQAELVHARFAMAGTAGVLFPTALGLPQWYEAGEKAIAGSPFPFQTLFAIQLFLMGWAETRRWMDIKKPGSQAESWFMGFEGNFAGTGSVGYPGQVHNPMGMGKDNMKEMQAKEIANGRLAMVSFMGYVSQYYATGKGPLQNLSDHIANPWAVNFATNGVSIPTGIL